MVCRTAVHSYLGGLDVVFFPEGEARSEFQRLNERLPPPNIEPNKPHTCSEDPRRRSNFPGSKHQVSEAGHGTKFIQHPGQIKRGGCRVLGPWALGLGFRAFSERGVRCAWYCKWGRVCACPGFSGCLVSGKFRIEGSGPVCSSSCQPVILSV